MDTFHATVTMQDKFILILLMHRDAHVHGWLKAVTHIMELEMLKSLQMTFLARGW